MKMILYNDNGERYEKEIIDPSQKRKAVDLFFGLSEETKEKTKRFRQSSKFTRANRSWEDQEDRILVNMYEEERLDFGKISFALGRTQKACAQRYSVLKKGQNKPVQQNMLMTGPQMIKPQGL